jgi:hypothetical protein
MNPLNKLIGKKPAPPEPNPFDRELVSKIEVVTAAGLKMVEVKAFNAMDGWTAKHQMREYVTSTDAKFRRQFTLLVLSRAYIGGKPLDNEQIVNDLLVSWENVEKVFKAVLNFNNIDYFVKEDVKIHWQLAGSEVAGAFMIQMENMLGPSMETAFTRFKAKEDG